MFTSKSVRRAAVLVVALAYTQYSLAPSPSSASPAQLPDDPAPAQTVPYDAWSLRESLLQSHSDIFGGLYYADDGSLVVNAVGGQSERLSQARSAFDAAQARGAGGVASSAPPSRLTPVANSMDRLLALRQAVLDATDLWSGGEMVNAVWIDDQSNTVRVGLAVDTARHRAAVATTVGARPSELSFMAVPVMEPAADRFHDVSPYNAGTRIMGAYSGMGCTTGFGVHQAGSGDDYLLTAAHCSPVAGQRDIFFNGPDSDPFQTQVGSSSYSGFGTYGWDTQLIRAESSTWTWTATSNRNQIVASLTPVVNDVNKVTNEGAYSNTGPFGPWIGGQQTVIAADTCMNLDFEGWGIVPVCHLWVAAPPPNLCAAVLGDSGGPLVSYSSFGPLAVGQVVARGGCSYVVFHAVGDMLARNAHGIAGGLHLNTTSDGGD